jgi:hypothetical protein
VTSEVELDRALIVIFLKITDAALQVMIVSINRCEGTGKGAVLCQDCSNATRRAQSDKMAPARQGYWMIFKRSFPASIRHMLLPIANPA